MLPTGDSLAAQHDGEWRHPQLPLQSIWKACGQHGSEEEGAVQRRIGRSAIAWRPCRLLPQCPWQHPQLRLQCMRMACRQHGSEEGVLCRGG